HFLSLFTTSATAPTSCLTLSLPDALPIFPLKGLTIAVLMLSTVMVTIFGNAPEDLARLSMICFAAGFCTNAGIVGLYAIFAHALDRKSTRLNSSHVKSSYAVFCLKKKSRT